jgi:hypothetical protein
MPQRYFRVTLLHFRQHISKPRIERALSVFDEQTENGAGERLGGRPDAVALIDVFAFPDQAAIPDDDKFFGRVVAYGLGEQVHGRFQLF